MEEPVDFHRQRLRYIHDVLNLRLPVIHLAEERAEGIHRVAPVRPVVECLHGQGRECLLVNEDIDGSGDVGVVAVEGPVGTAEQPVTSQIRQVKVFQPVQVTVEAGHRESPQEGIGIEVATVGHGYLYLFPVQ